MANGTNSNGKIAPTIIGGISIAGMIAVFTLTSYLTAPLRANDERLKEDITRIGAEAERECEEVKKEAKEEFEKMEGKIGEIQEDIKSLEKDVSAMRLEQTKKFGEILLAIQKNKEDK